MRQAIKLNKSGFFEYSLGSEQRLLSYEPVGINDWYMLRAITNQVIVQDVDPVKIMVRNLVIQISFVFIAFGILVFYLLRRYRKAEEREAFKLKTVTDNIPGGVAELFLADELSITYANNAFYLLHGISRYEFMQGRLQGYLSRLGSVDNLAEFRRRVLASLKTGQIINYEYQIQTRNGLIRWIALNGRVISHSKEQYHIQAVFLDITAEKERTDAIIKQTQLDPMTGLYNKTCTQSMVHDSLCHQGVTWHALIIADIDKFKLVNDTYGHIAGDEVIIGLAGVLKKYTGSHSFAGRIGGDEFMLFFDNLEKPEDVRDYLTEIQNKIRHMTFSDATLKITSSMGCIVFKATSQASFEELFAKADANLYIAKKRGPGSLEITME